MRGFLHNFGQIPAASEKNWSRYRHAHNEGQCSSNVAANVAAFSPCSSLERHHKQSLGHHNNDSGLSASVYNQTSSFKSSDNVLNVQSFGRASLVRGNQNPFGERSHTGIKVGRSRDRVLLPLLFSAKE